MIFNIVNYSYAICADSDWQLGGQVTLFIDGQINRVRIIISTLFHQIDDGGGIR
jgi:hypothetical protein